MELVTNVFGRVFGASGVQGFFGEGYAFHKPSQMIGLLDFHGITFVAKTATLGPRVGNMPLNGDYTPRQLRPDCVRVNFRKGIALNSVGLSNPGLQALLDTSKWQARRGPFVLSVMSMDSSRVGRMEELRQMVDILAKFKYKFRVPWCLQLNMSCPNTEHNPAELIKESVESLEIASKLGVPLMPKFSIATAPIEAIMALNDHPDCSAVSLSNTLPYDWDGIGKILWGKDESPLHHLGDGGLSGAPLRPLVTQKIEELRDAGFTSHINGGGGIMKKSDVDEFLRAGASSISLGTVAMLRPWRVHGIIQHAHKLNWGLV